MELEDWCRQAEELKAQLGEEYWKMRVGIPYSDKRIKTLEEANGAHNADFLKKWKEPRLVFIDAVESVASAKTVDAALRFEEERKKKISCDEHKHNGVRVNWTTWRQWAVDAPDKERKKVFDTFIEKVPTITPLIKERFEISLSVFEKHGTDPLQTYLEHHKLKIGQLRAIIEQLRDTAKPGFRKGLSDWTQKISGREPEYYDDFYYMRNKIYEDIVPAFEKVDALGHCLKTMNEIGLDPSNIKLDDTDRPGKYPSPFCFFIRVPTDIRVTFKKENPLNTAVSIYHEYGHAIHASNIDPSLPYWTKYMTSMGLAESFSTFFEDLIEDETYCTKELGLSKETARAIHKRVRFHNLFAVSFYCANSLFRIDTYEKKIPFEKWDELYAKHIKECMGLTVPGEYWQLHHILPESLMYVPSYLLAFVRSHEMHNKLAKEFGNEWWKSPRAGKPLRDWMKPGQDSVIADFSRLDVRRFLKRLKEPIY